VEELRRRLDDQGAPVHVIEVTDTSHRIPLDADLEAEVLYRPGMTMADVEKAAIEAALREHRGNRRQAAQTLGIGERTLYRKIKEYL
jgi:DNA-binding NtrC family response regulator